jgi:hypothetical protein
MTDLSVHGVPLWRPGSRRARARSIPGRTVVPDSRQPSPAAADLAKLPPGWKRLDALDWSDPCPHRADHVLVGPGGVFVVDALAWPGTLDIGPDTIRHDRRRRQEILVDVAAAAKAIRSLLEPLTAAPVHAVLCFARDVEIRGRVRSVHVTSTANLLSRLASFPVVLDAIESRRVADALLQAIAPYEVGDEPPEKVVAAREQTPPRAVRRHWVLHRP